MPLLRLDTLAAPFFFGLATLALFLAISGQNTALADESCSPALQSLVLEYRHTTIDGSTYEETQRFGEGGTFRQEETSYYELYLNSPDQGTVMIRAQPPSQ
ncbi:hypothetical protein DV096_17580 [Bradymonadaceae bacterium TMQ3]|nr:hypothetical protein DV096_17580 [Bradymonadaceae bacterium TMQ3]